jgi:negative regulator of flagellin synthesis FlgM
MVDPIGIKPGTVVDRRSAPVVSTETVAPTPSVTRIAADSQESVTATRISGAMAAQAPVDSEHVARIRKAVQDGRFPLVPSTIADRLLALKLQWNPNDQA